MFNSSKRNIINFIEFNSWLHCDCRWTLTRGWIVKNYTSQKGIKINKIFTIVYLCEPILLEHYLTSNINYSDKSALQLISGLRHFLVTRLFFTALQRVNFVNMYSSNFGTKIHMNM